MGNRLLCLVSLGLLMVACKGDDDDDIVDAPGSDIDAPGSDIDAIDGIPAIDAIDGIPEIDAIDAPPTPGCGDGNIGGIEQCDDGNTLGGDGCGSTCQFDIGCPAGQLVVQTNSTATPIPDNNLAGISLPVTVAGNGAVTKAAVYLNITHTYDVDLDVTLIGPNGVISRDLTSDNGGVFDNYLKTFLDDGATTNIISGAAPFSGRYAPEESLSSVFATDFRNRNAAGTWTLKVVDDATPDTGSFGSWSLLLCVDPAGPYCGDGTRNGAEECDDGNLSDTDGCTNRCQLTDGCGDGNLDNGELCDDNNVVSGDGCSSTCTPDITCAAGQQMVVLANNTAAGIPENDAGVISTIAIGTAGLIRKVTATILVTHASDTQLDIFLESPRGVQRELATDITGVNFTATTFSDAATVSITTSGNSPYTGLFRPEQSLSDAAGFGNQQAQGNWILRIGDDTMATATGTLERWAIAACIDTSASTVCGNHAVETGETCDDGNTVTGDGCNATCQVELGCGAGQTAVVISPTGAPQLIPDGSATGVSSVANVTAAGTVRKAVVVLGTVTHTFDSDLDIALTSPAGTVIDLTSDNGPTGRDYVSTIFDDGATAAVTAGVPPFTGRLRPEVAMSTVNTQTAAGAWTLKVADDATDDAGVLVSWTLGLCVQ